MNWNIKQKWRIDYEQKSKQYIPVEPLYSFERVILPVDNKAHNIKLSIYIGENDVKTLICVEEGISGRELKNIYAKAKGYDMNQHKIRLFFGGNEIKDNEFIHQHKIYNNYIIPATKV